MISILLFTKILLASSSAFTNAQTAVAPLIVIALLIDALVVAVWYFLGSLLNNPKVKGAAIGEFNQFIGTVILVGILVFALTAFSGVFYAAISTTKLMSPTAISTLCTNIESSSKLDMLGSQNSFLSGPTSSTGSFPGLCSFVGSGGASSVTDKLDYPLAAAAVVVANLTNQTAANLNSSFTMDAWLGFLQQLRPTIDVCIQSTQGQGQPCIIPAPPPAQQPLFDLEYSFATYAGYSILLNNLSVIGALLNLSVESFILQIIFISIFLYAWPWLLFGGIVLRSTLFTRQLGGLLIAIAISAILIYPVIFSIQYLSLGNGFNTQASSGNNAGTSASPGSGTATCNTNTPGYNSTYGFCITTLLPATPTTPQKAGVLTGNYVVNFFVEPNIQAIAVAYSCWPNILGASTASVTPPVVGLFANTGGLLGAEAIDIGQLTVPVVSYITGIVAGIQEKVSGVPSSGLLVNCNPQSALNTFFAMLNVYGIIGLISYLIPLINIVVTMSSIAGLSQLFGGTTSLAGLEKIL